MYAVKMDKGPRNNGDTTNNSSYVTTFDVYDKMTPSVIRYNSFMGHIITLDRDLDFRVDVAYAGRTINDGTATWAGKLERLKTGGCTTSPCSTATWGINLTGSTRSPSEVTNTFAGTTKVGPITAAPTVTSDDANNIWVFYGTGRYLSNSDKVDTNTQYLFGVKDKVLNTSCNETVSLGNCVSDQLVNVTNSVLCLICASGTNQVTDPTNTSVTTFDNGTTTSMVGLVASKDGWYVTMPAGERSVSNPTLIGGTVFFPSFLPTNDVCASTGTSYLYALFYKTGTAYTSPIIGTAAPASGTTNILNKITLGDG
jgi:type IV pilus assembly protein PilY1